MIQSKYQITKKCFLATTYIVMSLVYLKIFNPTIVFACFQSVNESKSHSSHLVSIFSQREENAYQLKRVSNNGKNNLNVFISASEMYFSELQRNLK